MYISSGFIKAYVHHHHSFSERDGLAMEVYPGCTMKVLQLREGLQESATSPTNWYSKPQVPKVRHRSLHHYTTNYPVSKGHSNTSAENKKKKVRYRTNN